MAARVVCVFTEQDAQAAARAEAQQNPSTYGALGQSSGMGGQANAFGFANANGAGTSNGMAGPRRATMQAHGLVGMGGMGGSTRPPGKSGLTFDHILSRLQGELQKSRETGAELHSLTGAMNDIHETLGGNLVRIQSPYLLTYVPHPISRQPPSLPPYPQSLPPAVPPQARQNESTAPAQASRSPDSSMALTELQSQLQETQTSLASHVEKIRSLEGMLAEHDAIKREVSTMRELMEERKREMELLRIHTQSPTNLRRQRSHMDDHSDEYSSDDDDARSISTIVPHELERVEEEDEEQLAAEEEEEEERRRRRDEVRPRTPEPTGMGMSEDDDEHDAVSSRPRTASASSHLRPKSPSTSTIPDELTQRLNALTSQLESALELSRTLQQQHSTAQSTISQLESKVASLESLVQNTQQQVHAQEETQQQLLQAAEASRAAAVTRVDSPVQTSEDERVGERESITEILDQWKKNVEGRWSGVQEEWNEERERLRRAREEWEARVHAVETGLETAQAKLDNGLASITSFQIQQRQIPNGHAKLAGSGGLVTPPSPRSLSAESTRPRHKKRRSTSRGRSRSRSVSPGGVGNGHDESAQDRDDDSSMGSLRHRRSWDSDGGSSASDDGRLSGSTKYDGEVRKNSMLQLPTPDPSVVEQPVTGIQRVSSTLTEARAKEPPPSRDMVRSLCPVVLRDSRADVLVLPQTNMIHAQTAIGVIVVLAAAAAVMWRVKPDGP